MINVLRSSLSVCWGLWTCSPQVPPAPPTSPCMRMMVANSADQWCYTFGFLKQIVSRLGFPTTHCTRSFVPSESCITLFAPNLKLLYLLEEVEQSLQSECSRRILSPLWIWLLDLQFTLTWGLTRNYRLSARTYGFGLRGIREIGLVTPVYHLYIYIYKHWTTLVISNAAVLCIVLCTLLLNGFGLGAPPEAGWNRLSCR